MSTTACPSCSARFRAIRYSDDPTSRPLAYRITHKADCRALRERQEKARASRPMAPDSAAAPNPAHAQGEPSNRQFAVGTRMDAAESQQRCGSSPVAPVKTDDSHPHSIRIDPEEAA